MRARQLGLAPGSLWLLVHTAAGPSVDHPKPGAGFHTSAQGDTVSAQVYEGWRQYSVHCARCHAQDVLNSSVAPWLVMSLKPDGPVPTKEEFLKVVREGRRSKGMPDFPADYLSDDRLDAIYAYVKGRSDDVIKPGRPVRRPE